MSTRVLVVEDEPRTRDALHEYFSLQGLDVRSTPDAAEAIAVGKTFQPDVLLCDWWLRGERDGVDVARALSEAVSHLNILFMTGFSLKSLERICDELPVRRFFKKPVQLAEVEAEIQSIADS